MPQEFAGLEPDATGIYSYAVTPGAILRYKAQQDHSWVWSENGSEWQPTSEFSVVRALGGGVHPTDLMATGWGVTNLGAWYGPGCPQGGGHQSRGVVVRPGLSSGGGSPI